MLRVLVVVVFVALCCIHGVVCACVFFVGVMGATVVLFGFSRDAQQNHCRNHHATRKQHYVFEKKHMLSHAEPLKASVAPLFRKQSEPLTVAGTATPASSAPFGEIRLRKTDGAQRQGIYKNS